jgi:NitT/TauT family transport system substrate-binding protein
MSTIRSGLLRRRRAIVVLVGLGAALAVGLSQGLSGTQHHAALTKVRFQLVWTASANATPFIVGEQKGFYKAEGLDLKVVETQDPTSAIPLVGSGAREIGESYPPDIMQAVAKGVPIVGVWAQYQQNPLGIVSLADGANIRKPKDMIGKTIGITPLPMDQVQFYLMLKNNGISKDQVKVVNPGFTGGALVGQGKLDGASGVPWFEVVALQAAGKKPILMQYRKNGGQIDFPFIVAMANAKWAKAHPDAVKAFVRGSIKAYNWSKAHRAEAVAIVVKRFPKLDPGIQKTMWNDVIPLSEGASTKAHNVGWFNTAQLVSLEKFLLKNKLVSKPIDAAALFSNQYQP